MTRFCGGCGREADATQSFCEGCGRALAARLGAAKRRTSSTPQDIADTAAPTSTVAVTSSVRRTTDATSGGGQSRTSFALLTIALLVGCAGVIAALVWSRGGGSDDEASEATTRLVTTNAPTTAPSGLTPAQATQIIDDINERAFGHWEVVPGEWEVGRGPLDDEALCILMTFTNTGRYDSRLGAPYEMDAVRPSGSITLGYPDPFGPLSNKTLVPGASVTGDVCFSTEGERGQFTVRYKPVNDPPRRWTFDT